MGLYQAWIERKEHAGAALNAPLKNIHAFEWGFDHLGLEQREDPLLQIQEYNQRNLRESLAYYVPQPIPQSDYQLRDGELTFPSTIESSDTQNNTVHCRYFPSPDRNSAIVIVPHWNAHAWKIDRLCQVFCRFGFTSLALSLPYHDRRGGTPQDRKSPQRKSTKLVSANIGLTLQAMQQSVQDIVTAVRWLELRGYRRVGLLGASIGSCAAFLAASHYPGINGFFANLMSSYFGEVVWTGISTRHVRESAEPHIGLDGLRAAWLLNSPIALIDKSLEHNPGLQQFIMSGRYDLTFQYYLSQQVFDAYDAAGVPHRRLVLPCGHYSLGKSIFKYIDGFYMIRFFKRLFRNARQDR